MANNSMTQAAKAKSFDSSKKREAKAKIVEGKFMQNLTVGGSAIVTTGLVAFILSKVPRIRYFTKDQKVPTVPLFSGALAAGGLFMQSPLLYGAGLGPFVHWFGGWIEQQTWAQPKG